MNRNQLNEGGAIELSLSYRPPFDCKPCWAFLAYRAIPGVEAVTERSYAERFAWKVWPGTFRHFLSPAAITSACVSATARPVISIELLSAFVRCSMSEQTVHRLTNSWFRTRYSRRWCGGSRTQGARLLEWL